MASVAAGGARRRLVLIDPYDVADEPASIVARVRELPGVVAEHVAVLDHWLRQWPDDKKPLPEDVLRVQEPTKLDQLRPWLCGQMSPSDKKSTSARRTANAEPAGPNDVRPEAANEGTRVLVVEDNEVNLRVVLAVLERSRFRVTVARDGGEGVEAFRQGRFDLVLMDCQMSVLDGLEATRQIRSLEIDRTPSSSLPRHVPIIALTANVREENARDCLEAGMNRFMTKPFRPKALLGVIGELLEEAKAGVDRKASKPAGPRVLVADDSPINRRVAQSVLARAGYDVVLAEDGQQAVDLVISSPVALVLMDCEMPVLDGLAATVRIRELEAAGGLAAGTPGHLPIVAVSGHTEDVGRDGAIAAGMDHYVTKPFRPQELLDVVRELTGATLPSR
jgi:CheY-like chemotaxis protein